MRGLFRGLAAIAFGALMSVAPADAASGKAESLGDVPLTTLFVDVADADSNFAVIDSRFDETATAAVLFGVVGAAATSAANASKDDKKADVLKAAAARIDLKTIIADNLRATVAGRGGVEVAQDASGAAHSLIVEIHNWGLLRVSRDDPRLRTFLNLSFKILDAEGRTAFEKKREHSVGQEALAFESFSEEKFTANMEALAAKAGRYIGNQIVYR